MRHRYAPAHATAGRRVVVRMPMIVARRTIDVLFNDYRRWPDALDDDRSRRDNRGRHGCGANRRVLHRCNHVRVHALLREKDYVTRLQRSGDAIGTYAVDD